MKITIKKVVVEEVTIPDSIAENNPYFQDTIDYILGLEFIATSCEHTNIKSFFGYSQGGINHHNVIRIELVDTYYSKLTFRIYWDSSTTYLIVDILRSK